MRLFKKLTQAYKFVTRSIEIASFKVQDQLPSIKLYLRKKTNGIFNIQSQLPSIKLYLRKKTNGIFNIQSQLRFIKTFAFSKFAKKGQGLVEYLIIIAIMGVASIGVLRTLNQTVKAKFSNAIYALQGSKSKASTTSIKKTDYQKIDFSNFMTGAASKDTKKSKSKR